MQFLGRTEFGLSIMAVERHTHEIHTNCENKKNTYKMQSLPLVSCSPAFPLKPKEARDGREWLKLVRINLINKCIFFSKQKKHHLYYSLLTVDDKNNQSKMAAAATVPQKSEVISLISYTV